MVEVKLKHLGRVLVVALSGAGELALLERIAEGIFAVAADSGRPLIVDTRKLAGFDAEGARALITVLARAGAAGREVSLICADRTFFRAHESRNLSVRAVAGKSS